MNEQSELVAPSIFSWCKKYPLAKLLKMVDEYDYKYGTNYYERIDKTKNQKIKKYLSCIVLTSGKLEKEKQKHTKIGIQTGGNGNDITDLIKTISDTNSVQLETIKNIKETINKIKENSQSILEKKQKEFETTVAGLAIEYDDKNKKLETESQKLINECNDTLEKQNKKVEDLNKVNEGLLQINEQTRREKETLNEEKKILNSKNVELETNFNECKENNESLSKRNIEVIEQLSELEDAEKENKTLSHFVNQDFKKLMNEKNIKNYLKSLTQDNLKALSQEISYTKSEKGWRGGKKPQTIGSIIDNTIKNDNKINSLINDVRDLLNKNLKK